MHTHWSRGSRTNWSCFKDVRKLTVLLLSNDPSAGRSHLPDLTDVTPVFWGGRSKPAFFVAFRSVASLLYSAPFRFSSKSLLLMLSFLKWKHWPSFKMCFFPSFQVLESGGLVLEPARKLTLNQNRLRLKPVCLQSVIQLIHDLDQHG